jgi:hypothetical protein
MKRKSSFARARESRALREAVVLAAAGRPVPPAFADHPDVVRALEDRFARLDEERTGVAPDASSVDSILAGWRRLGGGGRGR